MPVSHLRVDGRKRTERHDVIHHVPLALRMLCKGCYRISIVLAFSRERAETIQIRYVCTPCLVSKEREKKIPSSKISGYLLMGPNSSITLGIVAYAFTPL